MASLPIDSLLQWHRANRPAYRFRKYRDPYSIWICEIFLQQTRIEYAQEKLLSFLTRYPSLQSLASASLDDVLFAFQGMGYYRRAIHLKQTADLLVQKGYTNLPSTYRELRSLPGIGEYTASVILSVGYGQPYLCFDGNIWRLSSRLFLQSQHQKAKQQWKEAIGSLSPKLYGKINEAAMDLGRLICKSKQPLCLLCPLSKICKAREMGLIDRYPPASPKRYKDARLNIHLFLVQKDRIGVLTVKKGPFLKGQIFFPYTLSIDGKEVPTDFSPPKHKPETIIPNAFGHSITDHRITANLYIFHDLPQKDLTYLPLEEAQKRIASTMAQKIFGCLKQ